MEILKYKKIFMILSSLLVLVSIFSIFFYKLNLGIDFTGGSVLELKTTVSDSDIQNALSGYDLGSVVLRHSDEDTVILRTKTLDEETKNNLVSSIGGETVVERFNTIGPTLGNELKSKALVSLILVLVVIIFFIAYSFRHVSTPVSSWKYGFATIIALFHDVLITIGAFALFGFEIDALFITALLVVLGYSINDTIVVFDRVRDNLNDLDENKKEKEFENVLNKSFKQTLVRSFNTSFTTLIALFVLYFVGVESIKYFILALIIGIISGTYSSIFLAVPLLSVFNKKKLQKTQ